MWLLNGINFLKNAATRGMNLLNGPKATAMFHTLEHGLDRAQQAYGTATHLLHQAEGLPGGAGKFAKSIENNAHFKNIGGVLRGAEGAVKTVEHNRPKKLGDIGTTIRRGRDAYVKGSSRYKPY